MTIRDQMEQTVRNALSEAQCRQLLPDAAIEEVTIERPQDPGHGDFACSTPLKLARVMQVNPMKIAATVADLIPVNNALEEVQVARPGFINFFLKPSWLAKQVDVIRKAGAAYGNVEIGTGQKVQVEFVSVNPNGPLHVGHGRGAVFGSTLANVLEAAGYIVEREYYINDAGNQMARFYQSLYSRYLQAHGRDAEIPTDGYHGAYLNDLAQNIMKEAGEKFLCLPEEKAVGELGEIGLQRMVDAIRADLEDLRVVYDVWFSERSLYEGGQYDVAMGILRKGGFLTERDNAIWFKSTTLGDEKDKVVVRSTGDPTYIAGDVAYHYNKFFERGFDRVIDIWGADHQGHVPFMKALLEALGVSSDRLQLLLYQLVTLKRGDQVVRISTRTGDLITLRELVEEVGPDACRFVFLSRSPESQMEFDLDLAKKESSENPVYYVQYAHARIASILRLAHERGIDHNDGNLSLLTHEAELALIRKMLVLPELVETMANNLEPHHLPHYSLELATAFHWFYQQCRVVSSLPDEIEVTRARLKLVDAARVVLARCLDLMGMEAPEEM